MSVIKLTRILTVSLSLMLAVNFVSAQEKIFVPDLTVSGIKLGDRASAKAFLAGTGQRIGEDGRPNYFLYNSFATQVIKLTALSFDDPHFITEIEVFAVGRSYRNQHTQAEKIGYFETESGIFIGNRVSALTIIVGIPGVARRDRIGPKDIVAIKGEPVAREKSEDKELFTYRTSDVRIGDGEAAGSAGFMYESSFAFSKNKLMRYSLKLKGAIVAAK
ncbi:MAG: hypothetical protein ACT4O9_08305 [Blastocatellia bacterium]